MRLVASLATRGRPVQLIETLQRHMACMSRADTKMIVQVDKDDWKTREALDDAKLDPRVFVNVKPREDTVAAKWNRALSEPADVYLCSADDDPYVTPDLDEKILRAAEEQLPPDRIGMIYGDNANLSFPGVIAYTAQWAEIFGGKLQPEYFPYWFADHWTDDIGHMIGRIAKADVSTDQSRAAPTAEMREPGWWATWFDAAIYFRRHQARTIVESSSFVVPTHEIKRLLARLSSLQRIEGSTRVINDGVRAMRPGPLPVDERYARIKKQAVEMLPSLLNNYGMSRAEATAYQEFLDPPKVIADLPQAYA